MSTREVELAWLIRKIVHTENLLAELHEFFYEHTIYDEGYLWSNEFSAYFHDMLERKREQLQYEKHRAERLGMLIATGREAPKLDI